MCLIKIINPCTRPSHTRSRHVVFLPEMHNTSSGVFTAIFLLPIWHKHNEYLRCDSMHRASGPINTTEQKCLHLLQQGDTCSPSLHTQGNCNLTVTSIQAIARLSKCLLSAHSRERPTKYAMRCSEEATANSQGSEEAGSSGQMQHMLTGLLRNSS